MGNSDSRQFRIVSSGRGTAAPIDEFLHNCVFICLSPREVSASWVQGGDGDQSLRPDALCR